ncbi:ImmA/IrrE family metallo-endopeptidase [Peribacillus asahii]|uniref:ImmA/IrrE family metallo-endopeptidase n=1 Tax=Peribacillus asahii TaxID=228899 RepID=UPI00207938AC|nr:ImmA/IrrE family metallo-endopeptidase [Peribacillus asahii]USK61293.1 ImmA/IrrE family metallo-endopeptidase [Peribacillus asahii]
MKSIKRKVDELIKKYKTNDPYQIAKLKNIEIQYADLGNTLGFYFHDSRIKFININNNLPAEMQRFVCAHELGHAILHPRSNTPFLKKNTFFSIDKIEVEANTFAVELLLLDEAIYEYRDSNLSMYEACEMHGIPRELSHLKKI